KGRIFEVLELVGLADRAKDKVATYSLGMKQRLGIARALINNPKIVFLDEPMNGLDPQGMIEIRGLIKSLALGHNITFFITSHLLHEIEQVCSKIAIIKNGQVITEGRVDQLLSRDTERLELHTNKVAEACEVLKKASFIRAINPGRNKLLVEIERDHSTQLNELLVSKAIPVKYLIPLKESLEDYFIRLTNGGTAND
ncbi:MAG: ABC transporter ATP-binding protein, partial [Bacillota bacterium]|nr:ABC transporter ATP-binding protein [Bacillota bacterium]